MNRDKDPIAVVISARDERKATLEGALLARELSEAKVAASQDIVSPDRYARALQTISIGMMVLFHQGGAPSLFEGKVPNVGRIIGSGYVAGIAPLNNISPPPDAHLLAITRRIFHGKDLRGFLWFADVRLIPRPELTKFLLGRKPKGRPPSAGENYIVVRPCEYGYEGLLSQWEGAYLHHKGFHPCNYHSDVGSLGRTVWIGCCPSSQSATMAQLGLSVTDIL